MHIIDPHIHLFNLEQGHYDWLKADKPPYWSDKKIIAKSFTEQNLALTDNFNLTGFIHIEAGFDNTQPWREIAYLEQACQRPFRSIAFINLLLPTEQFCSQLKKLISYKSVVGCRHILDEQAASILTDGNAQHNLAILAEHQLMFEVQMPISDELAVDALISLTQKTPSLKLIINHAGLPVLNYKIDDLWLAGLQRLSQIENCALKCSGWEMADRNYSSLVVENIIQHCLTIFDEQRVMLASNFPLCLFSKNYQAFWQAQQDMMIQLGLTQHQQHLLMYQNAKNWYQLSC